MVYVKFKKESFFFFICGGANLLYDETLHA